MIALHIVTSIVAVRDSGKSVSGLVRELMIEFAL